MNQTVLLTGATGFLGSHLVKKFYQEGYQVIILKRSFSDIKRLQDILSDLIVYDIDRCELAKPFQEIERIDTIVHAATCYGRNNESASSIIEANVLFPLRLFELGIEFNTVAFLNTDTFINTDTIKYKYLTSYSLSKNHFLQWGKQLTENGKIRFINIKLEHPFGANDSQSKFTTYIINSCLNNVEQLELTPGEQKRDFIHIDDVVSAYSILLQKAIKKPELYQNYELGTGKSVSIREFVEMVHRITQSKTILKFGALPYREGEIMDSQANIQALSELGWKPGADLEDRLCQTIEAEKKAQKI
ncbi:MAG: NAD-dependent epimerase/dehydratase [Xenococcaceae cyanobacterium MO_207.B15]|nr:NAD-dependent epimerase/dehydratase [Xenococcaceae cyanobacterium MO_207.B15]